MEAVPIKVPQEGEGTYRWDTVVCRVKTNKQTNKQMVEHSEPHDSNELLPTLCLKGQGKRVVTKTQKRLQQIVEVHPT